MSIRRGRLRSTIKWGGAVLTVLLLIVWVGSGWHTLLGIDVNWLQIGVGTGRLGIAWEEPLPELYPGRKGWEGFHLEWWFYYASIRRDNHFQWMVFIPIWFIAILAAIPTFLLWRRDRILKLRERANSCRKCGYDRTGLPADRACPECGAAN